MTSAGHMGMMSRRGGQLYAQQDKLVFWLDARDAVVRDTNLGDKLPQEKWIVENWKERISGNWLNEGGLMTRASGMTPSWYYSYPVHPTADGKGVEVKVVDNWGFSNDYAQVLKGTWRTETSAALQSVHAAKIGTLEACYEIPGPTISTTSYMPNCLTFGPAARGTYAGTWYSNSKKCLKLGICGSTLTGNTGAPVISDLPMKVWGASSKPVADAGAFSTIWVNGSKDVDGVQSSNAGVVPTNNYCQLFANSSSDSNYNISPIIIHSVRIYSVSLTAEEIEHNRAVDLELFGV